MPQGNPATAIWFDNQLVNSINIDIAILELS
jgi:hypothetical protein